MGPLDLINGAGKLAESVCDAVLPKELEFVGDLASLAVNLRSGNWAGALADVVDLTENVRDGDLAPERLKEGLRKLLPPEFAKMIDDLIEPGPPPPAQPQVEAEQRVTKGPSSFGADGARTAAAESAKESARSSGKTGVGPLGKYSDAEIQQMVRNGTIPEEIKNDKAAMLGLQERLQSIHEMSALMTNLLRTAHEMQMEVIRNIRA